MSGPGAQPGEPIVPVRRFNQAANRLEVMRGMEGAAERLFMRMTRRFMVWNIRDGNKNFRLYDMDKPLP